MEVTLVLVQNDGSTKEIPLRELPTVVGRDEGCRVRIPAASVSRRHCELLSEDDELMVRDLGSSNGTFINGERVKHREIVPGDVLSVGPFVFVVRIDGFPRDVNAADALASSGAGGAASGHAGVPSWGGADEPKTAVMGGAAPGAGSKPAPKPPAGDDDDDDDDFSDLLAGLDLDDEDDEPGPKKK